MSVKEIGDIEVGYRYAEFKWKIPNFFSITGDEKIRNYESRIFHFGDIKWYFDLCLKAHELFPGFMSLSLQFIDESWTPGYSIKYNFGLQKLDGSVAKEITGVLTYKTARSEHIIFEFSEILTKKLELAPLGVLTVMCKLKMVTTLSILAEGSAEPRHKKLKKTDLLCKNFKDLLNNKDSCDAVLLVQGKEYRVHKSILIARSSVFAAMFQHNTAEKETGEVIIPDCDPESFQEFLEYVYCGRLEDISPDSAFHLYYTSDKYNMQELKAFCIKYLTHNLTLQNVCDVVSLSDKYDETSLLSTAQDFFNKNFKEIVISKEWEDLLKNNFRLANKLLIEMSKVKK